MCMYRSDSVVTDPEVKQVSKYQMAVTLNNASDYRANGLTD